MPNHWHLLVWPRKDRQVPKSNATASGCELVLEKTSLGGPNVWLFSRTRRSNGVPAMPHQLIESDRAVLAELLKMKLSKREIARRLGKHRSTIYRELARNTGPVGYIYQEAQQRTDVRRRLGRRLRKMNDPELRKYVCRRLKQFWSPDQIAGRLEFERRCPSEPHVSRQTIYAWIRQQPAEEQKIAGAVACVLGLRDENAETTRADCRMPSGSTVVRPSSPPVGATAIGKETRSSVVLTPAGWSRWWNASRGSRCSPACPIAARRRSAPRPKSEWRGCPRACVAR